jgi:predicted metal-dependent phosphoesterase TrpH
LNTTPDERHVVRADFHTHSTASDGNLAPADLVRQASERGLSIFALTDHDTTLGLPDALASGERIGLRVIPGIELSTDVLSGEIHILGYGIDPMSDELQTTIARLREASLLRIHRIVARLDELGYPLPEGSVRPSGEGASIGRPHVARAMIAAGYVSSVAEAFDRFLGRDRPAYVKRERQQPAEAVELVRRAGGLPVLAHPLSVAGLDAALPELIDAGLAGLEAYYGEYTSEQRLAIARLADERGLLATGGSDYHGEGFRAGRELGGVTIPAPTIARFLAALDAR